MRSREWVTAVVAVAVAIAIVRVDVEGQGRGRGGGPPAPRTAQEMAPTDLTGTWVAVVSEDWRWRMVTPQPGDVSSVPVNAEGRRAAGAWSLEKDNAAGLQCKAFGVGGLMRQPGRLRISWQDPDTLKLELDAGSQTRLLHFNQTVAAPAARTWQGHSLAQWQGPGLRGVEAPPGPAAGGAGGPVVPGGGGRGLRGGPPPRNVGALSLGASVKVVTTGHREGYLRKNGVPYSEQAVITEYFNRLPPTNGDDILLVTTVVEDPVYLTQPFYTSSHFRLEPDDSRFDPTPCQTAPPLPVTIK